MKPSLVDLIPAKIVLLLASPYIAGQTAEQAVSLGHQLYQQHGFTSTLDILGENSKSAEDCNRSVSHYCQLVDLVCASPLKVKRPSEQFTVSFKPSMFYSPSESMGVAFERIKQVVSYAFSKNTLVTLEAEDHPWADFQLETYFTLIDEGFTNLGTVIQSRLFRSQKDILRFDKRMRVRLVLGIYNEPAEIAHTESSAMKDALIELSKELLCRGTYVELASHDTSSIEQFFKQAVLPNEIPSSQFETQFLLGVPRIKVQKDLISGEYFNQFKNNCSSNHADQLEKLRKTGVLVRMYLPFGEDRVSGPYCRRRLKGNPSLIRYGIENLLHRE